MCSVTPDKDAARRPRVLLADDHALILEGFRTVLGSECELIGELSDGISLVKAALELQPDIVMLDIGLPGLNGIEAARQIRNGLPQTRIVFVTMHASPSYLRAALSAGADGYVLKTSARDELLVAVRQALSGQIFVTAGFGEEILESYRHGAGQDFGSPLPLTSRQRQILQLIAEGRTAKEMAATLNVSLQTIAFHKFRIMNRLSVRTTAELTKYAIKEGITGP